MTAIKILVVEDEMIIGETIVSCLTKAGYAVAGPAPDYKTALDEVKRDRPDLVIMDVHLKGKKDGIDAAKAIRQTGEMPVIFLTDIDDQRTIERAKAAAPMAAYLLKPFNERQMCVNIHQALHNVTHAVKGNAEDQDAPAEDHYILNDCLFIRVESRHFKKILLDHIQYLEADGAYSHIYTISGKHTYSISMNHVHARINRPAFVRVSRSHVVNLEKVDGIKGNMLLIEKKEISVGESFRNEVLKRMPVL